jgi:hypothetical protein
LLLKFTDRHIGVSKGTLIITKRTIAAVFAAICLGPAALRGFGQWHAAALTGPGHRISLPENTAEVWKSRDRLSTGGKSLAGWRNRKGGPEKRVLRVHCPRDAGQQSASSRWFNIIFG